MVRNARTRNASADNRHDGATRLATGVLSRCHAALLHLIATQIAFLVRRDFVPRAPMVQFKGSQPGQQLQYSTKIVEFLSRYPAKAPKSFSVLQRNRDGLAWFILSDFEIIWPFEACLINSRRETPQ
jgi:hypothetical protein